MGLGSKKIILNSTINSQFCISDKYEMSEQREALKEATLIRLSKAIMKEYPVTISEFLNNYNNMFQDTVKPEEFGCSTMDSFIAKVSIENNIWKTSFNENKLLIQPSRVSFDFLISSQGTKISKFSNIRPHYFQHQHAFSSSG